MKSLFFLCLLPLISYADFIGKDSKITVQVEDDGKRFQYCDPECKDINKGWYSNTRIEEIRKREQDKLPDNKIVRVFMGMTGPTRKELVRAELLTPEKLNTNTKGFSNGDIADIKEILEEILD